MPGNRPSFWPARLSAFAVAALCAASVVFWSLKWQPADALKRADAPAPAAQAIATLDTQLLAQRLGAKSTETPQTGGPASGNLQLVGVVAGTDGRGSAIIVVDGKPPKSFRVGSHVTEGLVLRSVAARKVQLAANMAGPDQTTLELPGKAKPAP